MLGHLETTWIWLPKRREISEKESKEKLSEGKFPNLDLQISNHPFYSRYGVFHQTIEQYFNRQWRAYTCPRVAVFWLASFSLLQHSLVAFHKTFPNLLSYKNFTKHPNYSLLGAGYSWFYLVRPIFYTYIFLRFTRWMYYTIERRIMGKDDMHYFWYYDTLYPDMLFDEEDMRYINFRYTD